MEEISKVKPYLTSADIIICITTCIKAYKLKALVKIKLDRVRVAGLRF